MSSLEITQEGLVQSGSSSKSTDTLLRLNCVENVILIGLSFQKLSCKRPDIRTGTLTDSRVYSLFEYTIGDLTFLFLYILYTILQLVKFSIEWYITNGILFDSDRKVSYESDNILIFPQKNIGKPQGKISIFAITQEGLVQTGSSSNSTVTLMRLNCVENFITI